MVAGVKMPGIGGEFRILSDFKVLMDLVVMPLHAKIKEGNNYKKTCCSFWDEKKGGSPLFCLVSIETRVFFPIFSPWVFKPVGPYTTPILTLGAIQTFNQT